MQGKSEVDFPKRMFQYFYYIYNRQEEKMSQLRCAHILRKMKQSEYDYLGTSCEERPCL